VELKRKDMATITLNYDARNKNICTLLGVIMNLGANRVSKSRKTGLDEAIEDVKKGRVFSAKDAKDVIAQCLQ
jgi:ClpP class serine protease